MPVAKTTAYTCLLVFDSKQHSAKIAIIIRYLWRHSTHAESGPITTVQQRAFM